MRFYRHFGIGELFSYNPPSLPPPPVFSPLRMHPTKLDRPNVFGIQTKCIWWNIVCYLHISWINSIAAHPRWIWFYDVPFELYVFTGKSHFANQLSLFQHSFNDSYRFIPTRQMMWECDECNQHQSHYRCKALAVCRKLPLVHVLAYSAGKHFIKFWLRWNDDICMHGYYFSEADEYSSHLIATNIPHWKSGSKDALRQGATVGKLSKLCQIDRNVWKDGFSFSSFSFNFPFIRYHSTPNELTHHVAMQSLFVQSISLSLFRQNSLCRRHGVLCAMA